MLIASNKSIRTFIGQFVRRAITCGSINKSYSYEHEQVSNAGKLDLKLIK